MIIDQALVRQWLPPCLALGIALVNNVLFETGSPLVVLEVHDKRFLEVEVDALRYYLLLWILLFLLSYLRLKSVVVRIRTGSVVERR